MGTFSAVVLVKNHRRHIRPCLETLRWCAEVVLVNDGSTDGTLADAAAFPNVRVVHRSMNLDWSAQMNFGIGQATGDWVLQIDADERVPAALAAELQALAARPDVDGVGLRILGTFLGRFMGDDPKSSYAVRCVRRGKGEFESRRVHAKLKVAGPVVNAAEVLVHLGPFPTAADYWHKNAFYAELEAQTNVEQGLRLVRRGFWGALYAFILKPAAVFVRKYFGDGLWRRGTLGLHYALMRAIGYYMVYLATWEKQQTAEDQIQAYCREHGVPYLD